MNTVKWWWKLCIYNNITQTEIMISYLYIVLFIVFSIVFFLELGCIRRKFIKINIKGTTSSSKPLEIIIIYQN